MKRTDAVFLHLRCEKTHDNFIARCDLGADDSWVVAYGLKDTLDDKSSLKRTIDIYKKKVRIGPQYKCPYCGNLGYVKCNYCNGLTCYNGKDKQSKCQFCHKTLIIGGNISSLKGNVGDGQ